MATDINGGKIVALINQLSLLVDGDPTRVQLVADGDWLAVYTSEIDLRPFPSDVVKFGQNLGFTYIPHDPDAPKDHDNYTRFQWLAGA